MAISLLYLHTILQKSASQSLKLDMGTLAMLMAALAARPAGAPPLPKPVDPAVLEDEAPDTEKLIKEKDQELDKSKKENEKLRHELNKVQLLQLHDQLLYDLEKREQLSLDKLRLELESLKNLQTLHEAESILHKADMAKYTAELLVKLEQQKSKAIIDYTKLQTSILQKAVDEARRRADELKDKAFAYKEQQNREAEAYRLLMSKQVDQYRQQTRADLDKEKEEFETSKSGLSPALQYVMNDTLKTVSQLPQPGASPVSLNKKAYHITTYIVPVLSRSSIVKIASTSYGKIWGESYKVPSIGYTPIAANTKVLKNIITLSKLAGINGEDFIQNKLIPKVQAYLSNPEFIKWLGALMQNSGNMNIPLPPEYSLGGLLTGISVLDIFNAYNSKDYSNLYPIITNNAKTSLQEWISTPEGRQYLTDGFKTALQNPEAIKELKLPGIFDGLLSDYTIQDLLDFANENMDPETLLSLGIDKLSLENLTTGLSKINVDPTKLTQSRIGQLSTMQQVALPLAGFFAPLWAAGEINSKIESTLDSALLNLNIPGVDKNMLREQLLDPHSLGSDLLYSLTDATSADGSNPKLGYQNAVLSDADQLMIVKLWPHINILNRTMLAGLLSPQYRLAVKWERPLAPKADPQAAPLTPLDPHSKNLLQSIANASLTKHLNILVGNGFKGSTKPMHGTPPVGKWDALTGNNYSTAASIASLFGVQFPRYSPDAWEKFGKDPIKAEDLAKEVGYYFKDSRLPGSNGTYETMRKTSPGGASLYGEYVKYNS